MNIFDESQLVYIKEVITHFFGENNTILKMAEYRIDNLKYYYENINITKDDYIGLDAKDQFNDKSIQHFLKHFNIDPEKFWLLLLWLDDYTRQVYVLPLKTIIPIEKLKEVKKGLQTEMEKETPGPIKVSFPNNHIKITDSITIKYLYKALQWVVSLDSASNENKDLFERHPIVKEKRSNIKNTEQDFGDNEEYKKLLNNNIEDYYSRPRELVITDQGEILWGNFEHYDMSADESYREYAFCHIIHWFFKEHHTPNQEFKVGSTISKDKWLIASKLMYCLGWDRDKSGNRQKKNYWDRLNESPNNPSKRNNYLKKKLTGWTLEKLRSIPETYAAYPRL